LGWWGLPGSAASFAITRPDGSRRRAPEAPVCSVAGSPPSGSADLWPHLQAPFGSGLSGHRLARFQLIPKRWIASRIVSPETSRGVRFSAGQTWASPSRVLRLVAKPSSRELWRSHSFTRTRTASGSNIAAVLSCEDCCCNDASSRSLKGWENDGSTNRSCRVGPRTAGKSDPGRFPRRIGSDELQRPRESGTRLTRPSLPRAREVERRAAASCLRSSIPSALSPDLLSECIKAEMDGPAGIRTPNQGIMSPLFA
jgi:hypothetical protein